MRLCIDFTADQLRVPIGYNAGIQAYLYSCLSPSLGDIYHDGDGDSKAAKPFTFSNIIGKYTVENKHMIFDGPCRIYVASSDLNFLNQIFETISETNIISLYGTFVPIDQVVPQSDRTVNGAETYNTLSPICVFVKAPSGKVIPLAPEDEEFSDLLKEGLKRKYQNIYGSEYEMPLNIYHFDKVKKMVCAYKNAYYEAYRCSFQVLASSMMHEIILDTGIGMRNSAGFGMVEKVRHRR